MDDQKNETKSTEESVPPFAIDIDASKVSETYPDVRFLMIGRKTASSPFYHLTMAGELKEISTSDNKKKIAVAGSKEELYADYALNLAQYKKKNGDHGIVIKSPFVSARIYIIYDGEIPIRVQSGLAYAPPSVSNPSVPGFDALFDKIEFSFDDTNTFWCNSTQVDFFAIPMTIQLDDSKTLGIKDNQRNKILGEFPMLPSFWGKLIQQNPNETKNKDGQVLRVLSPNQYQYLATAGQAVKTFWDAYIDQVWQSQQTININVGDSKYVGKSTGSGKELVFSSASSDDVSIGKPTSQDVWGCNGVFVGAGDDGAIKTAVAAAINRSVALNYDRDWNSPQSFYDVPHYHYARIIHKYSINHADNKIPQDGAAYAFPYDDYPNGSPWNPELHKTNPTKFKITLSKF